MAGCFSSDAGGASQVQKGVSTCGYKLGSPVKEGADKRQILRGGINPCHASLTQWPSCENSSPKYGDIHTSFTPVKEFISADGCNTECGFLPEGFLDLILTTNITIYLICEDTQ